MKIDFASSRQSTLGVEWELALVDAQTGELASVANEVLRGVAAAHPELNEDDEHPHIKQELLLNTVELVTGICTTVARGESGPEQFPGRGPGRHRPDGRRSLLRRQPPFQPAPAPARDGQGALREADRPHPVVGPPDGHLRRPRPRRTRQPGQGPSRPGRPGQLLPALPGALRVQPVLGRRGHRLRLAPCPDVPAAAHRRPAVPVLQLGGLRVLRPGHVHHRRDRHAVRDPLGHPPRPRPRHHRDAHLRRPGHPGGGRRHRRADPVPGGRVLHHAGQRRHHPDHAAVARAGEQMAGGPLRPGGDHHPGRRRATNSSSPSTSARRSSGWSPWRRSSAAATNWPTS